MQKRLFVDVILHVPQQNVIKIRKNGTVMWHTKKFEIFSLLLKRYPLLSSNIFKLIRSLGGIYQLK